MSFARTAGLLVVVLAVALALWPAAVGLDRAVAPTAALVLLALGFWATGALPFHLTALGLFALATVFRIAPPAVIFAGFASTALWLVFGGLVIGAAAQTTGLGRRLARLLVGHLSGSYRRIVYGTVGLGTALAFLVPAAIGRIMILMPIFAALAGELGFARPPGTHRDPARRRLRHHPAGVRDPAGQSAQHGAARGRRNFLRGEPVLWRLSAPALSGARGALRPAPGRADLSAVSGPGDGAQRGGTGVTVSKVRTSTTPVPGSNADQRSGQRNPARRDAVHRIGRPECQRGQQDGQQPPLGPRPGRQ